eukprot:jgi/Psemu1/36545/gm1.36545_g
MTLELAVFGYYYDNFTPNYNTLLNCCGVYHHVVFRELLLDIFEPLYTSYTVDKNTGVIQQKKTWTTNQFNATGCLALLLFWFQTRGSAARAVALVFGLTASPMYRWLKFGRKLLLFALQNHPAAKYPVLAPHRVWGACDGLKVHLQQSGNWMKQNQYYNGWTCGTYVNSVFIFAPDSKIWACILNATGCWHDSTQADYGLYEKMELLSEWEMQQIQGGFPQMKDSMLLEERGDRRLF